MNKFIEPYNPNWEIEFEELKKVIRSALIEFEISIQHVGSTSIPGMYAKPILDVDIIINNKDLLLPITLKLEKMGYKFNGEQGIPERFKSKELFCEKPLNKQFTSLAKPLHTGEILGLKSIIFYFLVCFIGFSLPITGFIFWFNKYRKADVFKK